MSSKISEIYTETSIQDLPDEMLEQILLFLNLDDRRSALRVCRRWSTFKPFDWSSVQLVVDFAKNVGQEANYHRTLLACTRQYKHLVLYFGFDTSKYELLVEILLHFSHKMETLKLIPKCYGLKNMRIAQITVIAQITAFCFNLRYLYIGECNIDFGPQDLEFSPMYKLEKLYLKVDLLRIIPNMMDIMPNITRLHMKAYSYSMKVDMFLRHFSSQLVELEIWFLPMEDFLMEREMHFPLLEKLNFYGFFNAVRMYDLFFHQLPLLKEVTLQSMPSVNRAIQNLCRSCVNIHFLCVSESHIPLNSFRAICELKNLKHLRLARVIMDVPPDMYSPLTSLQKLTLYYTSIVHQAEFNNFVQRAFPNLEVMELLPLISHTIVDRSIELYGQICNNMPSLQRLVVSKPGGRSTVGQFMEFCAFHAPKELRFKCWNIHDGSDRGMVMTEVIKVQRSTVEIEK